MVTTGERRKIRRQILLRGNREATQNEGSRRICVKSGPPVIMEALKNAELAGEGQSSERVGYETEQTARWKKKNARKKGGKEERR